MYVGGCLGNIDSYGLHNLGCNWHRVFKSCVCTFVTIGLVLKMMTMTLYKIVIQYVLLLMITDINNAQITCPSTGER